MTFYDVINFIDDIIDDTVFHPTMRVLFVNEAVRKAQHESPLHGLAPTVDPSDEIIEVLLAALCWDMQQRRFGLTVGLQRDWKKLHALSVELLDLLKENMPDRTGGVKGWNFEKSYIFHRVRDILLLGWSETSATRDLSTAILITASVWLIVQTTRRCISLYFDHILVKATWSTCGPWKQISPTLRKSRVMVLRHQSLCLVLLLTRRVKLVLVS